MESNIDQDKGNENPTNYNPTNMSSNWPLNDNNLANTMPNSCSSTPITDSFCPPIWDHSISGQNLSYGDVNAMLRGSMFMPSVPLMVPHGLPRFPADSGFIERAARLSCFSGGNFGDMMNPFTVTGNLNSYSRVLESMQGEMNNTVENERMRESLPNEAKRGVGTSFNDSDEAEYSSRGVDHEEFEGSPGESSIKGVCSTKRKRIEENRELNENNRVLDPSVEVAKDDAEIQQKGDPIPASTSKPSGKNGKQGSQGSDLPKDEYIRVRARRGQATNSHSLAERLRREKISERMKFLQDLVPGCSKVTGKAVMLDEIINYVQSLQRQVEFLSMKLATVNPRLNFNIEGLLTKDIVQSRFGPSSSVALPPDMTMPYPLLHQTPHGLIQPGLLGLGSPSNALRRSTNAPFTSAFREPTSQVPSLWEDELHSIVQMGITSSAALSSQDISGQVKAEP